MAYTNSLLKTLLKSPQTINFKHHVKELHAQILKFSPFSSTHLSTLVSIYCKFNLIHDSLLLFNTLHSPPVLAYKSIIRCYTARGLSVESLACFKQMRASGRYPDHNVFPSVLKSCTLLLDIKLGESVHGCIIRLGMNFDLYTGNALMSMYAKFHTLGKGGSGRDGVHKMLDVMPERKCFSGFSSELEHKFEKSIMGIHTNVSLNQDRSVLPQINAELNRRSSKMDNVRKVFEMMPKRDLVSWNTVIAGNAQNGMHEEALMMVREMGNACLKPDSFTLSSVLPIFAEYVDVDKGKEIHAYAIRHRLGKDVFIGSGLIDMYTKCTRVKDSLRVFSLLPQRDGILWNSVIAGCVQNGLFDEGLSFFRQMVKAKIRPKPVSFSSVLPACSHMTTLNLGKELHGYIIRCGFDDNMFVASSLVDMYTKCGNVKVARQIFDKMEIHDMVAWTAIIMGYALHGHAQEAISLFEQMKMGEVRPNYVAFIAVLTACSHAGLVDEAWTYFNSMIQKYGIAPGLEHHAAMADLLGRAGKLDEAYKLISSMDRPTGSVWSSLLGACRVHKNVDLAERVTEKILEVDPDNVGAYVIQSNIYAAARKWKDASELRVFMRDMGIKKTPACSWIEVKSKMHAFMTGDKSHPDYDKINEALKFLLQKMEHEGYVSDTCVVIHDVE